MKAWSLGMFLVGSIVSLFLLLSIVLILQLKHDDIRAVETGLREPLLMDQLVNAAKNSA